MFFVWRSEPSSSPVSRLDPSSYHDRTFVATFSVFKATFLVFKAFIFSSLTFKIVVLSLAFRAISPTWCLESLFLHSFAFKAIILSWSDIHCQLFGVRSYIPGVLSLHLLQFDIQDRRSQFGVQIRTSSLVFRVTISSQFGVQSYIPGVQGRHSQFGVQSRISNLAFRAASPVWRSESSSYRNRAFIANFSAFRATFKAASSV